MAVTLVSSVFIGTLALEVKWGQDFEEEGIVSFTVHCQCRRMWELRSRHDGELTKVVGTKIFIKGDLVKRNMTLQV